MIKQEPLPNGTIKTYSDQENGIVKNIVTGDTFQEAVDYPEWNCQYEEVLIELPENLTTEGGEQ